MVWEGPAGIGTKHGVEQLVLIDILGVLERAGYDVEKY
jgi:hypothetical protein